MQIGWDVLLLAGQGSLETEYTGIGGGAASSIGEGVTSDTYTTGSGEDNSDGLVTIFSAVAAGVSDRERES